jgi:fatty acid desaturase
MDGMDSTPEHPFAVFSSLILAWDPLVLDYATEVRAYSMEFAGIAFGCVLLDKLTFHRETLPALFTGIVFAAFLGSRYSFGLFAAAAFLGAMRLAAFAAPTAIAATVIFVVAFLPQYKIRMSSDGGAYLQYLAASTAAGKSWNDLLTMLARNLLGPSGIA